ncbi:MAG: hypothetical protein HFJ91_03605 [Muribaculaceae bacterium]|nr:hypothetical protein [Muribaculaceae bacterium]
MNTSPVDWISWTVLLWGLGAAYAVLIGAMIVAVLSENRNPLKSIAWITALLLFPVGGALLYYFFGRSLRNVRMISRRNRRKLLSVEPVHGASKIPRNVSPAHRQSMRLAVSVADAMVYTGNDIEIFNNGESFFRSLFDDLRRATTFINMQFYIIANDSLGRELRDILIERAAAGVKIRVIYDYIGSFDASRRDFFMRMKDAGVEVHSFFRIQFPGKLNRLNWRNHRKVVVIDGKAGYIGGGQGYASRAQGRQCGGCHCAACHVRARRPLGRGVIPVPEGDRQCPQAYLHTDSLFPAQRRVAQESSVCRSIGR